MFSLSSQLMVSTDQFNMFNDTTPALIFAIIPKHFCRSTKMENGDLNVQLDGAHCVPLCRTDGPWTWNFVKGEFKTITSDLTTD